MIIFRQYFDSGNLTAGEHTVVITSQVSDAIHLDYFLVPAIGGSLDSLALATVIPSRSTAMSTNMSVTVVNIAGGVIGGLFGAMIVVTLIICLLRRRQRKIHIHPGTVLPQFLTHRPG